MTGAPAAQNALSRPSSHQASAARAQRWLIASASPYAATAVLCAVILAGYFQLWKRDLRIPLDDYRGDAFIHQMLVKNLVDNGHYYTNRWLGAPGEQELYDFPFPHWTPVMVWWLLRLFSHNYGLVLNLYYLLTFPFCALATLYFFRRLGISIASSIAGALLFAFLPFHLLRFESHLFLSALYTVPLAGLIILWVATGNPLFGAEAADVDKQFAITRDGVIALACCVLVAWDHPYYAFFAATLLPMAGLLGRCRFGHRTALLSAMLLCAAITASLVVALLPNLLYFHDHGRIPVAQRPPSQSEGSPLTLAQLLAPLPNHPIPALARLRRYYDTNALMVNENKTASLGLVGSIGFFISLASLFRKRCSEFLYAAGICNLWLVLLGTMGGFGAIFAFLISPQIRAYNRVSVFIGFFSLAALIWAIDSWLRSRSSWLAALLLTILVAVAMFDQLPHGLVASPSVVEGRYKEEAAFIAQIEAAVPPRSMIFQLPYMAFPENGPIYKMTDYDPMIGYLHSKSLRWSYGAMRYRDTDRWLAKVSAQPADQLVAATAAAGFAGIYVDRFGYGDNGAAIESQLRSVLKSEPIADSTGRYLFFRITH